MSRIIKSLVGISCLLWTTNIICGCSLISNTAKIENNNPVVALLREFGRKGPLTQLKDWEYDTMTPALALEQALNKEHAKIKSSGFSMQLVCQKQEQAFTKALKEIKAWQGVLKAQEPVKGTDAYLYFSKNYLAKFEANLMAKMELAKGNAADIKKLESKVLETNNEVYEAKLAFDNAKAKAFTGQGTYRLSEIKESDISLHSTYNEIRKQLAMPGVFFHKVRVLDSQDGKINLHQPVLWSEGNRFLYIDFVDGRATFIKLYSAPVVKLSTNKKLLKQVKDWDANLLAPAANLYKECLKAESDLSKKHIYNEKAASQIKDLLETNFHKLKEYEVQVAALSEDDPESAISVKYAKIYVARMTERIGLFKELPELARTRSIADKKRQQVRKISPNDSQSIKLADAQWSKTNKAFIDSISKGNNLANRLVPESRFMYNDAKRMLLDGDRNYSFPETLEPKLSKNPWQMSISYWTQMPGELMQTWKVADEKNPKKTHNRQIYVWALGEEYLIGEFLDNRLQAYKLNRLNNGFWYGK